jgi:putative membrane protein
MQKSVSWLTILKGAAMGVAEIIPGVSGGTIAFITGIYERLMDAIKAFNFSLFKQDSIKDVWKAVDGHFLLFLFGGMTLGLVAGALGLTYLFENYPLYVWGFFFGLILASAIFVMRNAGKLTLISWGLFAVGVVIAFYITKLSPTEGSTQLSYIFLCGAVAITALMLPGISGSFILLLMGAYHYVLGSFRQLLTSFSMDSLMVLVVFGLGCLVGVVIFSRVISWTLKVYRTSTLAILAGFLLGSLNKIWPWRIPTTWLGSDGLRYENFDDLPDGKSKVLFEINVFPMDYPEASLWPGVLICFIAGFLLLFFLERKVTLK